MATVRYRVSTDKSEFIGHMAASALGFLRARAGRGSRLSSGFSETGDFGAIARSVFRLLRASKKTGKMLVLRRGWSSTVKATPGGAVMTRSLTGAFMIFDVLVLVVPERPPQVRSKPCYRKANGWLQGNCGRGVSDGHPTCARRSSTLTVATLRPERGNLGAKCDGSSGEAAVARQLCQK